MMGELEYGNLWEDNWKIVWVKGTRKADLIADNWYTVVFKEDR